MARRAHATWQIYRYLPRTPLVCGFDHPTIHLQLLDIAPCTTPPRSSLVFRILLERCQRSGAAFASPIHRITDRKLQQRILKRTGHDSVPLKPSSSLDRLCSPRGYSSVRRHFIHRSETPCLNRRTGAEECSRIGACHRHRTATDFRERASAPDYSGAPATDPRGEWRCMRKDSGRTTGASLRRSRRDGCQGQFDVQCFRVSNLPEPASEKLICSPCCRIPGYFSR